MRNRRRLQREKPNQLKEQKVKSLEFLKSILATTLAIVLALLLSVRPAQAGYIVTLQQVGPNVVATGSGVINLTGLTFFQAGSQNPLIRPDGSGAAIFTGPTSSNVDIYFEPNGPMSFGSNPFVLSARSGDMVGIAAGFEGTVLTVPTGYVSGTALSDMAVYSGRTLASLGVTPGTYVWTWGTGANQNFKLEILPTILPATNITNISSRA